MQLNLAGKVALVTGATGGLGGAIVRSLAEEGMKLVLTGRDERRLATIVDEFSAPAGAEAVGIAADLVAPGAAEDCIAAAVAAAGGLDLVVNAAGATRRGDFFALTDRDWEDGFALKFHGCVRVCRAAWPHLVRRKGAIVNIVGVGSRTPSMDFLIGGSVNNALLNFTKGLADRGGTEGVRVNAVNPGYFRTDRTDHRIATVADARGVSRGEAEKLLLAEIGVVRFGMPEEVGRLVAFLASDHAAYVHGATLDIDGGATRGL